MANVFRSVFDDTQIRENLASLREEVENAIELDGLRLYYHNHLAAARAANVDYENLLVSAQAGLQTANSAIERPYRRRTSVEIKNRAQRIPLVVAHKVKYEAPAACTRHISHREVSRLDTRSEFAQVVHRHIDHTLEPRRYVTRRGSHRDEEDSDRDARRRRKSRIPRLTALVLAWTQILLRHYSSRSRPYYADRYGKLKIIPQPDYLFEPLTKEAEGKSWPFRQQKGPSTRDVVDKQIARPLNRLYMHAVVYRTYRLRNLSESTVFPLRVLKPNADNLRECLGHRKFDGSDPIKIIEFLTILPNEFDECGVSEKDAYICLSRFCSGATETYYLTAIQKSGGEDGRIKNHRPDVERSRLRQPSSERRRTRVDPQSAQLRVRIVGGIASTLQTHWKKKTHMLSTQAPSLAPRHPEALSIPLKTVLVIHRKLTRVRKRELPTPARLQRRTFQPTLRARANLATDERPSTILSRFHTRSPSSCRNKSMPKRSTLPERGSIITAAITSAAIIHDAHRTRTNWRPSQAAEIL